MSLVFPSRQTFDLTGPGWSAAWNEQALDARTIADIEAAGWPSVPARVPGNFELDLQAAGHIGEPFFGMNIATLRRFESTHVWYYRRFGDPGLPTGQSAALILEGVDCFAHIYLNGRLIGECANMLISHEFPLDASLLRPAANELVIHLRPARDEARRFAYPPGVGAMAANYESLYVRKAPHMYGWDIMPRALSAGLWRPVRIEAAPQERLNEVWLETVSASEREARLVLHYAATLLPDPEADHEIEVTGRCGEMEFRHRQRALFEAGRAAFIVLSPRRWWPRGRGEPSLYTVEVRLLKNGSELDRLTFRHGIRTAELRRTSLTDGAGNGEFCFVVNGERVFILGTNWVPADAYHSRDAERTPRILALVEEVGCNLVRCWGGNVYEPDAFFDWCDEHGVLVWQDFAMACAVYPHDDNFCRALEAEARQVVRRLRSHASLLLWSGDNECDECYVGLNRGQPSLNRITREVLPRVLASEDPGRPYLPSSPYIDEVASRHEPARLPEQHLWGPRDYFKSVYYSGSLCHFASEIGYHGCPSAVSVRKFISAEKLWPPGNDEWLLHSTSPIPGVNLQDHRTALMCNQLKEMFGTMPDNLDDFAIQSQYVQAEAKKYFVELFRGAKWRRTGIVWWNLMDGWPQFSDAVVDYYFEKKLAFDFLRRAQTPLLMMLREPAGWTQELVVCNDTRDNVEVRYRLRDINADGNLAEGVVRAAGDIVTVAQEIPFTRSLARFLLIEWESAKYGRGVNHFLAGDPPFDVAQYGYWLARAYSAVSHER